MRIRPTLRGLLFTAALPLVVALPAAARMHLALKNSLPAADASTAPPAEIRLWFTEQPQDGATSIRLMGADEHPRTLGDVAAVEGEAAAYAAPVQDALAPGRYTVAWRSMAADGHVVRGEFAFTVTVQ